MVTVNVVGYFTDQFDFDNQTVEDVVQAIKLKHHMNFIQYDFQDVHNNGRKMLPQEVISDTRLYYLTTFPMRPGVESV